MRTGTWGGAAIGVSTLLAVLIACGSDDGSGGGDQPDGGVPPGDENTGADSAPPPPERAEFGLDARPSNTTCKVPARPPNTAPVKFEQVYANVALTAPMVMAQIPGDGSKWFVAQRGVADGGLATIVSFPSVSPPNNPTAVGNVGPLGYTGGEGGLLGMAFHPKFAANGKLFVSWTKQDGAAANGVKSIVGWLTNADKTGASFTGFTELFSFDQSSASNHKGGTVQFGKDGFLYASFGDGGNQDDFFHNGQNPNGFFSKVHRVDVDNPAGGKPYSIPDGNPFKNGGGQDTTFARGFRNPFRFSLDRETNQLWVGDVGGDQYEEIDKVDVGTNNGWPCREGMHDHIGPPDVRCPSKIGLTEPVIEQNHNGAPRAITGGVVYRGKAIPGFVGTYVFADYVTQELYALTFDPSTGAPTQTKLNDSGPQAHFVSFAEDVDGEVYVVAVDEGAIYKMVAAAPPTANTFPDKLSKTGCVDPADVKKPASGVVPYTVSSPLWSDGASKDRFMALPDGQTITVETDGDFTFPIGTVMMKTFTVAGKRIETRLFMRHDDGGWAGYTYEWLDDESDAVLLPSSKRKPVGAQSWYFPARSECVFCHSDAAGRTLGPELGQMNGDFVYPSTNRISNQLHTLEHIGMFAAPLAKPVDQLIAYPDPAGTAPADARARSYLHANCSNCHRPKGPGIVDMDLRFGTALKDSGTCNVDPAESNLGVAGAKRIVPGQPTKSLVSLRPHSPALGRMPPLATSVVDDNGVQSVDDWITSLTACP